MSRALTDEESDLLRLLSGGGSVWLNYHENTVYEQWRNVASGSVAFSLELLGLAEIEPVEGDPSIGSIRMTHKGELLLRAASG